jgi:hypothetical protein
MRLTRLIRLVLCVSCAWLFPAGMHGCKDAGLTDTCGNGTVDEGEACDGNCPESCDDGDACTLDTLEGSAASCSARCVHSSIVTCEDGDGCCPAGCSDAGDSDCSSPPQCGNGAITSPCECGGAVYSTGYCCNDVWQSTPCPFVLVMEAESGSSLGRMTVMEGALADPACGDSWVEVPEGEADFFWDPGAPTMPAHRTELSVDLPHDGTYYVWLRMASLSDEKDALYAGFDVADMRRVFPPDDYAHDGTWVWVSEVSGAADRLIFDGLTAGAHTFFIAHAEAGTRCDRLVFSDSGDAAFDRSCGPVGECTDGESETRPCTIANGTGEATRLCTGGVWGEYGICEVTGCDSHYHIEGNACVEDSTPSGDYPFHGYTDTRGAFEAMEDGAGDPRVLIVDRLSAGSSDGDETIGRGSLPWALARNFPRVILFEVSGTIDVGGSLVISSPYVSVHGQTAPPPGITLYNVELLVRTHDVVLQHLRVRMGEGEIGGGDPMGICGAPGDAVHDIIIDHCSAGIGHDEQLSMSSCEAGDVRRVTLSSNIIGFGINREGHGYGTLVDSSGSNDYDVDEILLDRNLWTQVSFRTPMIGYAARHVTITNNVTYNEQWSGFHVASAQYPEGQYIDSMHNLNWRGPETEDDGTWPTAEASTWPSEPDLWPWNENRRPVSSFEGLSGGNTHVYYLNNYDYVNNYSYTYGNHEGRPIHLEHERYYDGEITFLDIVETSRQTSLVVPLLTPAEIEMLVELDVGCTPDHRDAVDDLAVDQALDRTGGYIDHVGDLGVSPYPTTGAERSLTDIGGYPASSPLDDADGDGLTDLEEWIYGL